MSVQAMAWALTQQFITDPAARHVLLCLANYSNERGAAAFPSVDTLSRDTGLAERTIRYKLDALCEAGVIRRGNQAIAAAYINRHDRRPTVYDIAVERGAADAPGEATGCISQQDGVQLTTERGAPRAPNPPITTSNPGVYGAAAIALRSAGVRVTSQDPRLIAACDAGITAAHLVEVAALYPGKPAGYVIAAATREALAPVEAANSGDRRNATTRKLSAIERVEANIRAAHERDAGNVVAGQALRLAR